MNSLEPLSKDLPDSDGANRFFGQFREQHPKHADRLIKDRGLLSDVLTLASFSPLLAATLIQNPEYIWWLNRKRGESSVRNKDELLESLARFALTNSQIEPQILFARFRRRELLRIFLRDIRRLGTIAEITEEISNLADAILENALRIARQELDNRFGSPLEIDAKGREKPADFSVVSLGKLGSKELNYSSDIDLLFLYSAEGSTSGTGLRPCVTNREYFGKLAESIARLVGRQAGEGAAYRVDLRLRPHGRVGALAMSVKDTIRYYKTEAGNWERQVLIRSRSSAGNSAVYKKFFLAVESSIFSPDETVENALGNVRQSKEKIDFEHRADKAFDVKLGSGGIREIEFIAQALQLAYGGKDKWLRSRHTLISLSRLADRKLLSESELTELFDAYEFLRHLEHVLQMEHGLQTHIVPNEPEKRLLVAKRMRFVNVRGFEKALKTHSGNVHRTFVRVFGDAASAGTSLAAEELNRPEAQIKGFANPDNLLRNILSSFEKSDIKIDLTPERIGIIQRLADTSPKFTAMLAANPLLFNDLPDVAKDFPETDYREILKQENETDFGQQISDLRKAWSRSLLTIAVFDIFGKLSLPAVKRLQTDLAEASIETALAITRVELARRLSTRIEEIPLAVLALGKLGGGGIDYDSDLDLVLVYDEPSGSPPFKGEVSAPADGVVAPNEDNRNPVATARGSDSSSPSEFYSRAVEIFVTVLSSMTRDGNLYRVDLRLRPHGKNGASVISRAAFVEYMREEAAIWELLAYVKIRGVAGDSNLAKATEAAIRRTIHERSRAIDDEDLKNETRRVRLRLEEEKSAGLRSKEIDIKFGPGGMLDIYFVVRYLQLRDDLPEDSKNRSTAFVLQKLLESHSLSAEHHANLREGYEFLSALDHNLRLTVGRATRLPQGNQHVLSLIADRMKLVSIDDLLQRLTIHRLNIRHAFEEILGTDCDS